MNAALSRIFDEMSEILEILGANRFKVIAHAKVARALSDLTTDVATIADDKKKLTAIDGIGDGAASRIMEYSQTGRIQEFDELREKVPAGLLDILRIPGLGPKTVKLMWEKAGVTDLESLKQALDDGRIEKLPRMGAKTVQNIRDSLDFLERASERTRLGAALPLAEQIVEQLRTINGVSRICYAGSLRRGKETIGDIDVLAATTDPESLLDVFKSLDGVIKVLASGDTKTSLRIEPGIQVDLRIVPEGSFGAALMYFTGSKDFNVAMRERAIKRGMRLNEYGLFRQEDLKEDGDGEADSPRTRTASPVASTDEQDVFEALGLSWIPPEVRESAVAFDGDFENLITLDDVRAELHAHTEASDGRLTIRQLIETAASHGFHTIAVTDHSRSSVQANGLDSDRLLRHIDEVHDVASSFPKMTVLAGSEVDILSDGTLDYDDEVLEALDFVVASPHAALTQDSEKATQRLLRAIQHPLVHVLGHPTGRLIGRRAGLSPDIDALIEAAVEHDTALEINANSYRLDLRDTHVRATVAAGALIAIDTDAHGVPDFNQLRYGIMTARRGWLPKDQCINTWSKAKLLKWVKSKR